jgi:hypothetical protein
MPAATTMTRSSMPMADRSASWTAGLLFLAAALLFSVLSSRAAFASSDDDMYQVQVGDLSPRSVGHFLGLSGTSFRHAAANKADLQIEPRKSDLVMRLKTSRHLQLSGVRVGDSVYFGPCKMGDKWRPSMVFNSHSFSYAVNDQAISFVKHFYFR